MSIWNEVKLVHLASQASFSRGVGYYQNKAVLSGEQSGESTYQGQVSGSGGKCYDVTIDTSHPRKSTCTCPFAAGRRVICKHMVALYFFHFPKQADAIVAEWEEEEREREERYLAWEADYNISRQKKVKEIITYVETLSDDQVREKLIDLLLNQFDSSYPDEDECYDDYF